MSMVVFIAAWMQNSKAKEGKFYVWTQDEIQNTLGTDFDFFKAAYGITPPGNWEGKTILQRALDDTSLAARFKLDPESVRRKLSEAHERLLQVRDSRVRPATDDKILVMWNALALSAFAEAGRYLGRQDYLDAAIRNARFSFWIICTSMTVCYGRGGKDRQSIMAILKIMPA